MTRKNAHLPPIGEDAEVILDLFQDWKASGESFLTFSKRIGVSYSTLRARFHRYNLATSIYNKNPEPEMYIAMFSPDDGVSQDQCVDHVTARELRRQLIIAKDGEHALKWLVSDQYHKAR